MSQVIVGFETVFTLQNGRLAPKDKNSNGDDLEVGHSLLRIYPPRVTLLPIKDQDYPDLPVKTVVSEAADALLIMPIRGSELFTTPDSFKGQPLFLLPPTGNPDEQEFQVIKV